MFSRLALFGALLAIIFGVFQIAIGVIIGTSSLTLSEGVLMRSFAAPTAAALIMKGLYTILFAIGLGTLGEIGLAVRKETL